MLLRVPHVLQTGVHGYSALPEAANPTAQASRHVVPHSPPAHPLTMTACSVKFDAATAWQSALRQAKSSLPMYAGLKSVASVHCTGKTEE